MGGEGVAAVPSAVLNEVVGQVQQLKPLEVKQALAFDVPDPIALEEEQPEVHRELKPIPDQVDVVVLQVQLREVGEGIEASYASCDPGVSEVEGFFILQKPG